MNDDDRLLLDVRSWLKDEEVVLPDAGQAGRRVAAELPETGQLRRTWWWLPSHKRIPTPPTTDQTIDYQPSPVPGTNGHAPTVTGRTQSMLSPVKAITAGALIFAIGGAFLIAQPFDQLGIAVPGAEGETVSMDTAWVTGTLLHAPNCAPPKRTAEGAIVRERGYRCESQLWETDDSRLNGKATPSWNTDVYRLGPDVSVSSGIYEVETESGTWLCSYGPTVAQGSGFSVSTNKVTVTCAGEGAHLGLMAVLDVDVDAGSIQGLVFPGEVPPPPDATGQ